jgi:hypothetical protein
MNSNDRHRKVPMWKTPKPEPEEPVPDVRVDPVTGELIITPAKRDPFAILDDFDWDEISP